jgi:outer membrane receptor for ferrienterochelin and colicin
MKSFSVRKDITTIYGINNKFSMKHTGFTMLLLFVNLWFAVCQTTVTGFIRDSLDNSGIGFAYIRLLNKDDSNRIITGAIADSVGRFSIEKAPQGNFDVEIASLGYKSAKIAMSIALHQKMIDLGNLFLAKDNILLDEVVIQGEKQTISLKADRKILHIDETMSSAGESAADLMQMIPEIRVDNQNITLKNQSFTIFINNKPSNLSPSNLFQMPVIDIDKIEVITSPSAKYKPDGLGGIVNIIYKKYPMGVNGIVQASAGTDNYYTGAFTFNRKSDKFNFFTSFYPRHNVSTTTRKAFTNVHETNLLNEYSTSKQNYFNETFKLGFDYDITVKDFFTFYWQNNYYTANYKDTILSETLDAPINAPEMQKTDVHHSNYFSRKNIFSVNYKHVFDSNGTELSVDFLKSLSSAPANNFYREDSNQNPETIPYRFKSEEDDKASDLEISFSIPVWEKLDAKLETGLNISQNQAAEENEKSTYDNGIWTDDYNHSFSYNNTIAALYTLLDFTLGKFNFIFGSRLENFHADFHFDSLSLDKKNNSFYPSLSILYGLDDESSLNFSYDKRVERPESYQLSPIVYIADYLTEMYVGNPDLTESFSNAFELGYLFNKKNYNIHTSFSYRNADNVIEQIFYQENGLRYKKWGNIMNVQSCEFDAAFNYKRSFLTATLSASVYNEYFTKKTGVGIQKDKHWNYDIRFIPRIKLKKGFNITLQTLYYSPQYYAYSKRTSAFSASLTASKTFMKNLTISLRMNNFIHKIPHRIAQGENFTLESYEDIHNRALYLGVFYKFGKDIKTRAKTDIHTKGIILQREN